MSEEAIVTREQFVAILVRRYKRIYCEYPKPEIVEKIEEGANLQFDTLENEGLLLIDKKTIEDLSKCLRRGYQKLSQDDQSRALGKLEAWDELLEAKR